MITLDLHDKGMLRYHMKQSAWKHGGSYSFFHYKKCWTMITEGTWTLNLN